MVSARAASTAHAARGYRLWIFGSADHVRRNRRQGVVVQRRDSGYEAATDGAFLGAGTSAHGAAARPGSGSRSRPAQGTAASSRRSVGTGYASSAVGFATACTHGGPADAAADAAATDMETGSAYGDSGSGARNQGSRS